MCSACVNRLSQLLLLLVLLLALRVRPGAAAAVGAPIGGGLLTFAVQEEAPNGTKARGLSTPLYSYSYSYELSYSYFDRSFTRAIQVNR